MKFSSLIPRMLIFTLVISCLTTSNLPWCVDLIFLWNIVLNSIGLYLNYQTHLQLGIFFYFGLAFSFLLELFVWFSPVVYWVPNDLGSLSFSVFFFFFFLPFHTVHGVLKTRILKWFAISFVSGPCFVRTLNHYLGWRYMAYITFVELNKAVNPCFCVMCFFFNDPADVDNLISGSSAFSKTSLNIWKFTVPMLHCKFVVFKIK